MGDAGEWREFVLRRLLRELVEKAGGAETVEGPGEHQEGVGQAVHPALAAPGTGNGPVAEIGRLLWDGAGADCAAWWLNATLEMLAASGQQAPGKRSPTVRARRLQNPFPATWARAIINAVHGFPAFPEESWRVRPPPGTDCQGSSLALPSSVSTETSATRCVTRRSGVEHGSSGVHVDAGHHPALAVGNRRSGRLHRKAVVQF